MECEICGATKRIQKHHIQYNPAIIEQTIHEKKRHIEGIVVTIEPTNYYEGAFDLLLAAYVNGIKIEKRGMFFSDGCFEDSLSIVFAYAEQAIQEQIKNLDAINWDKDKIREMGIEGKE